MFSKRLRAIFDFVKRKEKKEDAPKRVEKPKTPLGNAKGMRGTSGVRKG